MSWSCRWLFDESIKRIRTRKSDLSLCGNHRSRTSTLLISFIIGAWSQTLRGMLYETKSRTRCLQCKCQKSSSQTETMLILMYSLSVAHCAQPSPPSLLTLGTSAASLPPRMVASKVPSDRSWTAQSSRLASPSTSSTVIGITWSIAGVALSRSSVMLAMHWALQESEAKRITLRRRFPVLGFLLLQWFTTRRLIFLLATPNQYQGALADRRVRYSLRCHGGWTTLCSFLVIWYRYAENGLGWGRLVRRLYA